MHHRGFCEVVSPEAETGLVSVTKHISATTQNTYDRTEVQPSQEPCLKQQK